MSLSKNSTLKFYYHSPKSLKEFNPMNVLVLILMSLITSSAFAASTKQLVCSYIKKNPITQPVFKSIIFDHFSSAELEKLNIKELSAKLLKSSEENCGFFLSTPTMGFDLTFEEHCESASDKNKCFKLLNSYISYVQTYQDGLNDMKVNEAAARDCSVSVNSSENPQEVSSERGASQDPSKTGNSRARKK